NTDLRTDDRPDAHPIPQMGRTHPLDHEDLHPDGGCSEAFDRVHPSMKSLLDFSDPLPRFDIRDIPFSRRGSWLNLSPVVGLHRTARDIPLVSHVTGMHAVLALRPVADDGGIAIDVRATP